MGSKGGGGGVGPCSYKLRISRIWGGAFEPQGPSTFVGLGLGVWGLGFRVWGLGFRVWGLGFRVLGV